MNPTRRGNMWALRVGAMLLPLAPCADVGKTASAVVVGPAQGAIERGLQFLATRQNPDGSFPSDSYGRHVAIPALAGIAFAASGSTPGRGPYGRSIDRSIDYLISHAAPGGLIDAPEVPSRGPMYGHGFATLFLAEMYGMSGRPELRQTIANAVELIVQTQNDEGGWRYEARAAEADISVTICQVMALRAARNAGFHVPSATIDRCIEYVLGCQNPDGGFRYQRHKIGGESGFARTAAGLVALHSAGVYHGEPLKRGYEYLIQFQPSAQTRDRVEVPYYYYGHYYAAQAMWRTGDDRWQAWYSAIRDELVQRQQADGSWSDPMGPEFGPEYATSMALIVLQIPNNGLPILQR